MNTTVVNVWHMGNIIPQVHRSAMVVTVFDVVRVVSCTIMGIYATAVNVCKMCAMCANVCKTGEYNNMQM